MWSLLKMAHWLLASDRPLANARGSATLSNQGSCLPSRDREGVVADSFSDLSLLNMAHWLLPRPHFHGSIVSRKLMNNCATSARVADESGHMSGRYARLPKTDACSGFERETGSVMLKTDPFPSSLSTVIFPFIRSMMCLTIESPKPVPPTARDRALSTL
ncbi:MAG: hypothetical protein JWO48_198 [Bryobacterales bacterium]|nr:hypothetical protein [Bryobacterales bacterium]